MGRIFSSLSREMKNYNVENRALKAISQEVRPPPPQYSATVDQIKAVKDRGISIEDLTKKDDRLSANLKDVYVVSRDKSEPEPEWTNRNLPVDRIKDWSDLQYGYVEPGEITPGKVSLKTTLDLLSKYDEDPAKWSTEKLASHYKINSKLAEQLVDRYQVFELHMPDGKPETKKNMTLEARTRLQAAIRNIRQITLISDKNKPETKSDTVAEIKTS